MRDFLKSNTLSTGLAMFSMFFGAGNVVFPLIVGQQALDQSLWATLGFTLTAILLPFLGLLAMALCEGNYHLFFERIGKIPGFLLAVFVMLIIGPFGALPRSITLSHSTLALYLPSISLPIFSACACIIIYLLTVKRSRIIEILGLFLTPILLVCLLVITVKGFLTSTTTTSSDLTGFKAFISSLTVGYKTLDLFGAIFFSAVTIDCLKRELHASGEKDLKKLSRITLQASCIGAGLLAVVCVGFIYVAAFNSDALTGIDPASMLGSLAVNLLGSNMGSIAILAVILACLTTAIALACAFAEFLQDDILQNRLSYSTCLIITIVTSFFMSTLEFKGIDDFISPFLQVVYPAFIALTIGNILHKLYGFKQEKILFGITFIAALIASIVM